MGMLVLSRKAGERIIINNEIIITAIDANTRGQIRFGVEAPKSIPVHREEVQRRINKEKELKESNK